jgi:hypothetical protein
MIAVRNWRPEHDNISSAVLPHELQTDSEHSKGGLPHLHGTLAHPASCILYLTVRLHNQAGIPIIEGRATVAAGAAHFTIHNLVALGIDAYQHYSDEQRAAIAQRIWRRCAYATIGVARDDIRSAE